MDKSALDLCDAFMRNCERNNLFRENDKVLFLFSGGKDASFGLHSLIKYIKVYEKKIEIIPLLIAYPKHVYYSQNGEHSPEFNALLDYYERMGCKVQVYCPDTNDFTSNEDACKVCKDARKKIIDSILEKDYDEKISILTGYTLFDIMAYVEEFLVATNFTMDIDTLSAAQAKRIKNCLHKIQMVEGISEKITMVRPLVNFNEHEILVYMNTNSIPYIKEPCIAANSKHKRGYFKSLDLLGNKINVTYEGIVRFLDYFGVVFPSDIDDIDYQYGFIDC